MPRRHDSHKNRSRRSLSSCMLAKTTRYAPLTPNIMWILALFLFGIQTSKAYIISHPPIFARAALTTARYASTSTDAPSSAKAEPAKDDKGVGGDPKTMKKSLRAKKKTLYQILGAQPTDTRPQLKQRYVAMARICHPDAKRNRADPGGIVDESNIPDFSEVAAAWKILSDPLQRKRYDRSLQAEEFSENVLSFVGEVAKEAAPVAEIFGNAMNNFLRRTTATTLAGVQAASTQVRKGNQNKKPEGKTVDAPSSSPSVVDSPTKAIKVAADPTKARTNITVTPPQKGSNALSQALKSAVDAAKIAGRKVDSMELLEQSETLEQRAMREAALALQAKQELQELIERRLTMALHTVGSGLTAAEAIVILEDFNKTINFDLSAWDRAMLRHTIEYEIQELQKVEASFVSAQQADTEAQSKYQTCLQANFQAKQNLVSAEKKEIKARQAWEDAKEKVVESKHSLNSSVRELAQAEVQAKKSDWEMEVRSLTLERQAEKVRVALRDKEKVVHKERGIGPPENDVDNEERLKELNTLRKQEQIVAQTSLRLETLAERLFEKARMLRERARELD